MLRLTKQTCIFFLLPTASSFLVTSLSGWGGGDAQDRGGEGGCTCILGIPPGYAPACDHVFMCVAIVICPTIWFHYISYMLYNLVCK